MPHGEAPAPDTCEGCPIARERSSNTCEVECVCGRIYGQRPRVHRRTRHQGPAPDRRVQVVVCTDSPGRATIAQPQRPAAEDPELVRVRMLLAELRPDRMGGPFGWAPDGAPPKPQSDDRPPVRVDGGGGGSDVPSGAFARTVGPTAGATAWEKVQRLRERDPIGGSALAWLQTKGTLADGLRALYEALGQSQATVTERLRWKPGRLAEGQRVVGKARVEAAKRLWWGEEAA